MAFWQTGVQWAPPPVMLDNNHSGALEHVGKNFAKWTQKVARAVTRHKNDADPQEARRRSGPSYGKHGLSAEEEQRREERQHARANYYWTLELNRHLQASRGKEQSGAAVHTDVTGAGRKAQQKGKSVTPKPWSQMSRNEQWWLQDLWSESLLAERRSAEGKCLKMQGKDFVVDEED